MTSAIKEVPQDLQKEIRSYLEFEQIVVPEYITPPIAWAYNRWYHLVFRHSLFTIQNYHRMEEATEELSNRTNAVLDALHELKLQVESQLKREA